MKIPCTEKNCQCHFPYSIKQKHEDRHFETTLWEKGMPIFTGYGFSQNEADVKLLQYILSAKDL